ncbi:MAG: hypothetical protein A2Z21_10425 [Candidatus Fraserbacteria bacterium RBG_16_55_9]|uniref:Alkaline shock response membrane anchor protein AmaP n=1 Tax=Fraserbacteria sp. (strain RBG_16_55_9) TaxID=1817864 RepID=A0A1F5URR9_FRAXR|nr:MAG: hypothetical protein A2Z21_10425 [Candidatus Fraserbacteria bacterium RBG_16_55_9]
MKRWASYLFEFCSWVAMLLLLGVAGVLFALLQGQIQSSVIQERPVPGYIVGVLFVFMAIYFAVLIVRAHRQRRLITHVGVRGAIRISPQAVRDFIVRVLEEELGLPDCRVRLKPTSGKEGALAVLVRAPLPLGQNILEVGQHVQETLKARVEERIGIPVEYVEVFTSSISAPGASAVRGAPTKRGSYITHFSEGDFEGDLRD